LANTVVANSPEGGNCRLGLPTDSGNNFADDDTCGPGFGTITGLDPVLRDNGGPTLTHALRPHSTARDAAGDCGLGTDQRGAPRDDGACDSGAFESQGVLCGNGQLDPGEECDDANDVDGDGCDSNCTVTRCGNGIVTGGEECDDGNQVSCDGCSSDCVIEEAYVCGDGIVDPACEECDDGNNVSCDGCSENCQNEVGYLCGDGMVNPDCGEECDDGNNVPCDGCSEVCEIEIGGVCGDGILNTDCEECDDGNIDDGDGCAADCTMEQDVPATTYPGMAVAALLLLAALTAFLLRRRTAV
jgi:cysteine-rich repeat protein